MREFLRIEIRGPILSCLEKLSYRSIFLAYGDLLLRDESSIWEFLLLRLRNEPTCSFNCRLSVPSRSSCWLSVWWACLRRGLCWSLSALWCWGLGISIFITYLRSGFMKLTCLLLGYLCSNFRGYSLMLWLLTGWRLSTGRQVVLNLSYCCLVVCCLLNALTPSIESMSSLVVTILQASRIFPSNACLVLIQINFKPCKIDYQFLEIRKQIYGYEHQLTSEIV